MIAPKKISLTINGKACEGDLGQTILDIARASDITIPTLCYLKGLTPWGGCRMCIVEIEGSPKVVPSCATPAMDGSKVITQSDRLQKLRRATLELLFSERNHICPMCQYNKGDCGLQHQGYIHGIDHIRYKYLYPALPVDVTGKYFGMDQNRCILCARCVRTCDEVEGVHVLDVANRGIKNQIVVDMHKTFGESETCTSCGACVASCPTGSLFDKASAFRGQLASCQQVVTTCIECSIGCGLKVYTKEDRVANVWGDPDSPVNRGHLCVKGRYQTWAEPRRRILTPMVRRNGQLTPVSWKEALETIRKAATGLKPNQKALLVSPRLTNETIQALKKFERVGVFVAKEEAALCGAGDRSPDGMSKIRDADAVIVLGAQPSRDNGVVSALIRGAVRKRGAKLLIFHARKSDLDQYADICAPVVSVEHKFWDKVAEVLRDVTRPVLVYGPNAMTPIGVTVLERLIQVFESKQSGQPPALVALPVSANSVSLAAAGIEPLEEVAPWIDERALKLLQIVASDEPDGGARLLEEKHMQPLLDQIDCVVLQAAYESPLTGCAHVVLPALVWSEKTGTITNFEGRELRLQAVVRPGVEAREDKALLEALSV